MTATSWRQSFEPAATRLSKPPTAKKRFDALKQISPDLVVKDILMPRLDGYEFVRRMREIPELAATPVIFYTATYHERGARALAYRFGATDVLTKPSAPNLILATIDAALDSSLHAPSPPLDRPELDREHRKVREALDR